MKVLVIGSGLIGVTTAYCLKRRGHDVTVLDRQVGPARETSFANGGLLTPSMAEPWNAPESWRVLLGSIGRSDAALQVRLRALPTLVGWGIAFLRNSAPSAFERNTLSNLRLALYSLQVMESLRHETGIQYGRVARGSLRVFRDSAALDQAFAAASRRISQGLPFTRLSTSEAVEIEPALAPIAGQLSGALHYRADEVGDAYRFSVALAEHAQQQGVHFRFGTEISAVEARAGRVTAVASGREHFVADRYVVAAGSYSTQVLRHVGVRLPVRPVKGYSITFDDCQNRQSLRVPVVDDQLHAVVVTLEGVIRVAGTAEFAGYDLTLPPARIRTLVALLNELLPQAQLDPAINSCRPWCGLRPMSADGVPIIGPTPLSNLLVSTGHGHLGWTTAAGSAELLTDIMCGHSTSIDSSPFSLARFGPNR